MTANTERERSQKQALNWLFIQRKTGCNNNLGRPYWVIGWWKE
jgi:hypothetical protein